MTSRHPWIAPVIAVLVGCTAAPPSAMGQPSALPTALAGMTCRGTFIVPNPSPRNGMGALQHHFTEANGVLSGSAWRAWGEDAYKRAAADIDAGRLSDDMAGFENIGSLIGFTALGDRVFYSSRAGARYDLTLQGNLASGRVDPRGVPGQEHFVVAAVRMICRKDPAVR